MNKTNKLPQTTKPRASPQEVTDAIQALGDIDLERLQQFAYFQAKALAGFGAGINGTDLLQQSIERTLLGKRTWNTEVSFVQHLLGVIRSLASHTAKKF